MGKQWTTNRLTIVALAAAVLLSGCGTTDKVGNWLRGKDKAGADDATIIGAPDAGIGNQLFSYEVQGCLGAYEASQGFSGRFQEYLRALCDTLAEKHAVRVIVTGEGRVNFIRFEVLLLYLGWGQGEDSVGD